MDIDRARLGEECGRLATSSQLDIDVTASFFPHNTFLSILYIYFTISLELILDSDYTQSANYSHSLRVVMFGNWKELLQYWNSYVWIPAMKTCYKPKKKKKK